MSIPTDPHATGPRPRSLAAAPLPARVRAALEELYALAADELSRQLDRMLVDYEQQLFRAADHARSEQVQGYYFETLRSVRQYRADLVPRFLMGLESALARIRDAAEASLAAGADAQPRTSLFHDLRLVEDDQASEETLLRSIAVRQEARASLPLQLLGQRFGVLAQAPAFDAETLPVGPHRLGAILHDAMAVLHIDTEARLLLLRTFEQQVMPGYAQLIEAMNTTLARNNVLPGLSFVPLRLRPRRRSAADSAAAAAPARLATQQAPHTGWFGEAAIADPGEESAAFDSLQSMLSQRRTLIGKLRPGDAQAPLPTPALPTTDLLDALGRLQASAPVAKSLAEVRQALLLQGRQQHGEAVTLSREDSDTFELLGMLYTEIGRELREGTPSTALLERLQVPLLRVAIQDREFFVRSQHPARQLLNAVAESGARWLADDDNDPQLGAQLRQAVDHVVENYDGDSRVFEAANHALQEQLQAMARKAEVSERRHVEAARGKEKLALAKQRAAELIDSAVQGHTLPRFALTLLGQAWADVLTLALLRHGEGSDEWRWKCQATAQIVAALAGHEPAPAGLDARIQGALAKVGYHDDEAAVIARRLTARAPEETGEDDGATRTELAMKLKTRARLGEDAATKPAQLPHRTVAEQTCYDHLRTLPFGTWFELAINQQGDMVRRRLSWFSPVTDNALFVNQRGQRVGEQSMDSLARMMAMGQARVVTADKGRLVDRAWASALGALRRLSGRGTDDDGQLEEAGA